MKCFKDKIQRKIFSFEAPIQQGSLKFTPTPGPAQPFKVTKVSEKVKNLVYTTRYTLFCTLRFCHRSFNILQVWWSLIESFPDGRESIGRWSATPRTSGTRPTSARPTSTACRATRPTSCNGRCAQKVTTKLQRSTCRTSPTPDRWTRSEENRNFRTSRLIW